MEKRYIVKPENKLVIALRDERVDDSGNLFNHIVREGHKKLSVQSFWLCVKAMEITAINDYMNSLDLQTKAIAKCSPEDEFNLEEGKYIAAAKLDMKHHKHLAKCYEKILQTLHRTCDEITALYHHHLIKAKTIEEHLDKRYNSKSEELNGDKLNESN